MIKKIFKRLFCLHLQWEDIGRGIFGHEFKCTNCNKIKSIDFIDYILGRNIPINYIERT